MKIFHKETVNSMPWYYNIFLPFVMAAALFLLLILGILEQLAKISYFFYQKIPQKSNKDPTTL